MHVLVHIGAKSVLVSVGEGDQPVRWLANVGVARHDEQQGRSLGVPIGVKIDNGTMLNMQDSIAESGLTEVRAPAHTPHRHTATQPTPAVFACRARRASTCGWCSRATSPTAASSGLRGTRRRGLRRVDIRDGRLVRLGTEEIVE